MTRDDWKEAILGWSIKILAGTMGVVIMKAMHRLTGLDIFSFPNLSSVDQVGSFVGMWVAGVWILERPIQSFVKLFRHEDPEPDGREQWLAEERRKEKAKEEEPPDDGKIRVIGYL
jgi:ABC-type nickel/cobalt efflux system permease component RcnA